MKENRVESDCCRRQPSFPGLTLEGLIISYYVRRSVMYDTLMQMGRWFGYRPGYEDLTRIYTTAELAGWFSELAFVEHRLREDLRIYEEQELTPVQVGMRIWQHPTMQVTSPLKRRFASSTTISQTYSLGIEQTFKFPLTRWTILPCRPRKICWRCATSSIAWVLLSGIAPGPSGRLYPPIVF